jgi:hypothetical protein
VFKNVAPANKCQTAGGDKGWPQPTRSSIRKNASRSILKRLAKALGVPVTALLS